MFGVAPAHALYTGPGPWLGLVLGLLVVGVLCAAGPVIDAVGHKPANSVPAAPQAPPIASAPPVASGQDIQGQDGKDGPH